MTQHTYTAEDYEKKTRRQTWRRAQDDLLAERARLVEFWTGCAETNRNYLPHNGCWCWTFYYMNPTWRKLVMPRVRALLDERDRQRRERMARESREYSDRCRLAKEAKARAKALAEAPPMPLFGRGA
jgi:hypothetical protein